MDSFRLILTLTSSKESFRQLKARNFESKKFRQLNNFHPISGTGWEVFNIVTAQEDPAPPLLVDKVAVQKVKVVVL